jgi:hypothetical protein
MPYHNGPGTNNSESQDILERELERLQQIVRLGFELNILWVPTPKHPLSGEVKHDCIFIYDTDVKAGLATLRHEFIDYVICQAIEPYRQVTNQLIKMVNDIAYTRKERVVEAIHRFVIADNANET